MVPDATRRESAKGATRAGSGLAMKFVASRWVAISVYVAALAAAGFAIAIRALLTLLWGFEAPLITYFPAIAFSAWIGGFRSGAVTTLACALAVSYLWFDSYHPLWRAGPEDALALAFFVGIGLTISGFFEALDRPRRWLAGKTAALEGLIEERARAEAALRASETRLAGILGSAMDAIISVDRAQRIILFNRAAEQMFLCSAQEAMGQPIGRFIPARFRTAHRSHIEGFGRTGVTTRSMRSPGELVGLRADGQEFPIEATISQVEAAGERIFTVMLRDVTERRRAERTRQRLLEQTEAARAQAQATALTLSRVLAVADVALEHPRVENLLRELLARVRTVVEADTATILLLTPDGKYFAPVASDGLREEVHEDIRVPLGQGAEGRIAVSERGIAIEDLSTVELASPLLGQRVKSLLGAPLRVEGKTIGLLHVGTVTPRRFTDEDLTLLRLVADRAALAIERARLHEDERAARGDAEAANRAKDEILAILSHELRAPLNSILMWTQVVQKRRLNDPMTVRALESIERQTKVQAQIIGDLLDVSRIIARKLTLDVRPVELAPVIEAALEAVRPSVRAKELRLKTALDPGIWVTGDPLRLQQVVWNLLANAVKFTPPGGQITLALQGSDSQARIVVRDNGQGIPPAFLSHVFDRFRQADPSPSRKHTGLGLGLAIVHHLVERHGGTVSAESAGEGQGATFTVNFPRLLAVPSRVREVEVPGRDFLPRLEGVRVLVVDDDADAREAVAAALARCGAQVKAAASAAEALAAMDQSTPHVLVSDIGMPGQDGYDLIRRTRARVAAAGGNVPAAALTAYAGAEDAERALATGYQAHLPKPRDARRLAEVVAELAERATAADPNQR